MFSLGLISKQSKSPEETTEVETKRDILKERQTDCGSYVNVVSPVPGKCQPISDSFSPGAPSPQSFKFHPDKCEIEREKLIGITQQQLSVYGTWAH